MWILVSFRGRSWRTHRGPARGKGGGGQAGLLAGPAKRGDAKWHRALHAKSYLKGSCSLKMTRQHLLTEKVSRKTEAEASELHLQLCHVTARPRTLLVGDGANLHHFLLISLSEPSSGTTRLLCFPLLFCFVGFLNLEYFRERKGEGQTDICCSTLPFPLETRLT